MKTIKKIMVYLTIIVGALFGCTVDSLPHPIVVLLGAVFMVLIILDFSIISRKDMEELFYDEHIKQ